MQEWSNLSLKTVKMKKKKEIKSLQTDSVFLGLSYVFMLLNFCLIFSCLKSLPKDTRNLLTWNQIQL